VYSSDPITDLAIVKITNATEMLPAVKLGSSKKMRAGDWVVALGCPLGFQNSVSAGIIGAISRFSDEIGQVRNNLEYYQTDLNIDEGNSGGPLINLRGEVIGVNTIKVESSGLSFSMRVDSAMEIISQLSEEGRVVRPFLGLKLITLSPTLLDSLEQADRDRIPHHQGVLVTKIFEGSPADRSGLRVGDVITKINGGAVSTSSEVLKVFGNQVGEEFRVQVKRKGQKGRVEDNTAVVIPTELNIYVHEREAQFLFQD